MGGDSTFFPPQATPSTVKKYLGLIETIVVVWLVASNATAFIKCAKLLAVVSFNSDGSHRLISALLYLPSLPSSKVPLPPQFKFGCAVSSPGPARFHPHVEVGAGHELELD